MSGRLARGVFATVRFPARRLPPGTYQMELELVAAGSDRFAKRTSPTFVVGGAASTVPRASTGAAGVLLPPIERGPREIDREGIHLSAPAPVEDEGLRLLDVKVTDPETIETAIVGEINRVRQARGLSMLRVSSELARAGDAHSRALAYAGEFTHDWPADGAPFERWIPRFYARGSYRAWRAGENLLWTSGRFTARAAVAAWMASPPHRRVMLTPTWREVGVGVVRAYDAPGVYQRNTVAIAAAEFGLRGR